MDAKAESERRGRKVPADQGLLALLDSPLWRRYYLLVRRQARFPRRHRPVGLR